MEEVAYASPSIMRRSTKSMTHTSLQGGEEEYDMSFSSPPCNVGRIILRIFVMEEMTYLQNIG